MSKGHSMKDFTRIMSAQSKYQAKIYSQYYMKSPHAIMRLGNTPMPQQENMKGTSGVAAIDNYFRNVNNKEDIHSIRNANEISRVVQLIQQHWKANKYPKCEQKYVLNRINKQFKS